jgi:hypothetical protein
VSQDSALSEPPSRRLLEIRSGNLGVRIAAGSTEIAISTTLSPIICWSSITVSARVRKTSSAPTG